MRFFTLLFLCFIISAVGGSRRARRRRIRERRARLQTANVINILSSNKLSPLSKDYYDSNDYLHKVKMCPFMDEHIAINGKWPQTPLSLETKDGFSREYFAKVYKPENFPLTYRKSGVYFDINGEEFDVEMKKYYKYYCEKSDESWFRVIFVATFLALMIFMIVVGFKIPNRH